MTETVKYVGESLTFSYTLEEGPTGELWYKVYSHYQYKGRDMDKFLGWFQDMDAASRAMAMKKVFLDAVVDPY